MKVPRERLTVILIVFGQALLWAPPLSAQPFPLPRLTVLTPAGGKTGSTIDVIFSGADLDEAESLLFSHPGFKAERITPPAPKVDPKDKKPPTPAAAPDPRFKVAIASEVPPGIYDVRLVGKWGISNPRAFVVGALTEVSEKEPNSDVPQAQRIELGSVVTGTINPKPDVDYFVFAGKRGQHVVVHAAAFSIDSKLNPYIQIYDANDRELASSLHYREREAVLDCVLPTDCDYYVRLCEFTYIGAGPDYFYRLSISEAPWIDAVYPPVIEAGKPAALAIFGRNLPEGKIDPTALLRGKCLEKQSLKLDPSAHARRRLNFTGTLWPHSGTLDGFEIRVKNEAGTSNPGLVTFTDHSVVLDNEDNDTPAKAQPISLPIELCGRIEKPRDRDWYVFTARKGDVYVLEGFADRLRSPIDLYFQLRKRASTQLTEVDDHDIPPAMGRLFTRTDDPKMRWVVPEDGDYELLVRSRTADMRGGARHVYHLSLRREQPDFQLLVVGNNDASAGGCTVRRGCSQDLEVYCFRRDGFDGEVMLSVEGLPAGVACPSQVLGPKLDRTVLVVSAAPHAAFWAGNIQVRGSAVINGQKVAREGRPSTIVWPTAQNNVAAVSRVARSLALAVRDQGVFNLTTPVAEMAVPIGGTAVVKLGLKAHLADFKVPVALEAASAPAQPNGKFIAVPKFTIAVGKNEGEAKIPIPANTVPGNYNLVFRGQAKYAYSADPKAKKKNVDIFQVSPPINLVVFDKVAEITVDPPNLVIPAGGEATLNVKLRRLHDYKGDFKLSIPKAPSGMQVAEATIGPNVNEAKLLVRVAAKTRPEALAGIPVQVVAKLGTTSLTAQATVSVRIVDAKGTAAQTGPVQEIKLLPAGADSWKYLPAAAVKGDDWTKLEFKDSGWKSARVPLGYGEPEVRARKGMQLAETGQPIILRREFQVPPQLLLQKDAAFRLAVASDDCAVVYLNGVKIDDDNTDHEFQYWNREVVLRTDQLRPGVNLVAVLVRNATGSSDLYFDLEVVASVAGRKASTK